MLTGLHDYSYFRLKVSAEVAQLKTISTFFPSGLRKATFCRGPAILLPILVDPAGTNFEAWAIMQYATFLVKAEPSIVNAPLHCVQPPGVCGPYVGSFARFHSRAVLLQFLIVPIIIFLICHQRSSWKDPYELVHCSVKEAVVDCSHNTGISCIQVKGCTINKFIGVGVAEDGDWVVRTVEIVVVNNYFCLDLGSCEFRTKVIFNKISLAFSSEVHTWVIPRMKWLILGRDCIDVNPFTLHSLYILNKIQGITVEILQFQASSLAFFIIFHPCRRTPRSRHNFYFRIYCQDTSQHRNEVDFIKAKIKSSLVNICLAFWKIIVAKNRRIKIG